MYKIMTKKRANSRRHEKTLFQNENIDEVISYCKVQGIKYAGTPYIFSHIKLSDGSIVVQEVRGLTCSPIELKKAMVEQLPPEVTL